MQIYATNKYANKTDIKMLILIIYQYIEPLKISSDGFLSSNENFPNNLLIDHIVSYYLYDLIEHLIIYCII